MSLMTRAAERARARRKALDLSREDLGKKVGRSEFAIRDIEIGRTGIDLEMVEKLAAALNMEPLDLLYPGELPKPMKPTPEEALEVIAEALKSRRKPEPPKSLTPAQARILAALPTLDEPDCEMILGLIAALPEAALGPVKPNKKDTQGG